MGGDRHDHGSYELKLAIVWIGWGYGNRDHPDLMADGVAAPGLHSFPSNTPS